MDGLETSQAENNQTALNTGVVSDVGNTEGTGVATNAEGTTGNDAQDQHKSNLENAIPKMEKRIGKVTGELKATQDQLRQAMQVIESLQGLAPKPKDIARSDLPAGAEGDALWAQHRGKLGALEVLNERDNQARQRYEESQKAQQAQQEYAQKVNAFQERAKAVPNLLDRMSKSAVELPDVIAETILESTMGAHIADYLLSNPAEVARLETLTEKAQEREMLKLELHLESQAKARTAPQPTAGAVSKGVGAQRATMQSMSMQQIQEYYQKNGKFPFGQ